MSDALVVLVDREILIARYELVVMDVWVDWVVMDALVVRDVLIVRCISCLG